MNKNGNKTTVVTKKKTPEVDINRQLPTELKDKAIELFTKQSDELAKEEANKRKVRQKQKGIFVNSIGKEINIDDYVATTYAGKSTHFFPIFYNLIADLMGISRDEMKQFRKPVMVPKLKRKLVYGRFPNAVQEKIYLENKYTGYCTRDYWNYQLLTKSADSLCVDYIKDFQITAESVLENKGGIKEFIIEHSKKYGLPIQLDFFESMGDR